MCRDAVRAMLLANVHCPKCNDENKQPPAKPTIDVDDTGRATCDTCGQVWTINLKEKP